MHSDDQSISSAKVIVDVNGRTQKVFRSIFNSPNLVIEPHMTAKDLDDWDSVQHVLLIVSLEKEFGIKFLPAEVIKLKNISDMLTTIKNKISV